MMRKFRDEQNNIGYAVPKNSSRRPRLWLHSRETTVSEATERRIVTLHNDEVHGVKNEEKLG